MTAELPPDADPAALHARLACAEARAARLDELLRAMRSVGEVIAAEPDRRQMLARACAELLQRGGWRGAWVAALDVQRRATEVVEACFGAQFARTARRLAHGELTPCAERALQLREPAAVADLAAPCPDCDLAQEHHGSALIAPLRCNGHVNGVLYVSPGADRTSTPEDQTFVAAVAASLGLALHALEVAAAQREALARLREHSGRLEELIEVRTGELRETVDELQLKTSALDSALAAIAITDFEGRILLVNRSFLRLWRYEHEQQLLGRHVDELAPAAAEPGERVAEIEAYRADGSRFPARITANVVTDPGGRPLATMLSFLDLTEQRAVAARLRAAERQATLAQLARGVGHELRQPLGAIKNASYLLRMVLAEPDPDVAEALGIVERELEVSSRIIEDLAAFAHPAKPAPRHATVEELLRAALARRPAPPHVELALALGDPPLPVFVDPRQIGQVFAHLLANAYQAMTRSGTLEVRAAPAGDEHLDVVFADCGVGIAAADLPQIFDPLFTRKARGIGFGLALARSLAELNGGSIAVCSTPGEGSRFTVRLPRRSPEPLG